MLLIFIILTIVSADLPIHCVKHQIVGKWKLAITDSVLKGVGSVPCGHAIPDNESTSNAAMNGKIYEKVHLEVELKSDNTVLDSKSNVGSWTMVYDEGFEVNLNSYKYFAFNKYEKNQNGQYVSYCGETLVGWFTNTQTNERGCYKGTKLDGQTQQSQSLAMGHVVQPIFIQTKQRQDIYHDQDQILEMLQKVDKSWTARKYDHLNGKSVYQINQMAGRKKISQKQRRINDQGNSFIQVKGVSDLPKQFSWERYLKPAREQQDCGSCYAIATMAMLSMRLRIKGERVELSPQQSLDCNYYNQGCNGGIPFLINKFATENDLVPESSYPYTAQQGECKDTVKVGKSYGVSSYGFIGGAYGKSNERAIMEEIKKNGPVVVSFEPNYDFMYYGGGIYHSLEANWMSEKIEKPEWKQERIDHSVLCYGWGEENGEKYWMLQNSWGSDWGENGNFRMKRGVDESGIESMGEAGDAYVKGRGNELKMNN